MTGPLLQDADGLVDWGLAARTAVRLARPGPRVEPAEARRVVELLRSVSATAPPHVARVSQLIVPAGPPARVVERGAWAQANVVSFRSLLGPVVAEALEQRAARSPRASGRASGRAGGRAPGRGERGLGVGRRVTGLQLGSLLAVLSSRVLGQYDALGEGPGTGDLLLVAPNVLAVQRSLGVDLRDFSLWVSLHEETHRVQFAAAPWLAGHLRERARGLSADVLAGPGSSGERVAEALRGLRGAVSGERAAGGGLLDLATTADQRRSLAEVTAVMALLEGHADVVMDEVGPSVVPTVATIRRRFTARRGSSRGLLDVALRHGLGLEAKLRQYADGARFVRGVVDRVGMAGLNAVWSAPAALPRPEEVADPAAWVRRVHG